MSTRRRDERGTATVLALALAALLLLVALASATAVALVVAHRRAQGAADLAALAAAQALQRGDDACTAGQQIAAAQHAALTACVIDGEEVDVIASVPGPSLPGRAVQLRGRARAGPEP